MAALDGTTSMVSLEGGMTLTAPGLIGNAEVHAPGPANARAIGIEGPNEAFDSALESAEFNEIHTIVLDVERGFEPDTTRAMRTMGGEEGMVLEVPDLGETVGQVVVAIDNGVVTWNFPQDDQGQVQSPATRGSGGVKRFVIRKQVPSIDSAPGTATRGLFGAIGKKILKVLVYPVTDAVLGPIGAHYAGKWESKNRPHNVRRFTVADYQQALPDELTAEEWQHLATGRALLFVHGTFSTAHGGFGKLPAAVLNELHDAYQGRVFAFDHSTLSVSPEDNVNWFNNKVKEMLPGSSGLELDIICHSRGGLVSRTLAGELASAGTEYVNVKKVIFVATPNQGTVLANPDHVVNFLDRYTSALDLAPPGPVGVVSELLEAILMVVKVFGHAGLSGLDGLASMDPDGPFITGINNGETVAAQYFGMSSNYEPPGDLRDFTMMNVGDSLVDRVFESASNDLVVPTDGVNQGNPRANFPITGDRSLRFNAEDSIWHSDFFSHSETQARIRRWLLET